MGDRGIRWGKVGADSMRLVLDVWGERGEGEVTKSEVSNCGSSANCREHDTLCKNLEHSEHRLVQGPHGRFFLMRTAAWGQ